MHVKKGPSYFSVTTITVYVDPHHHAAIMHCSVGMMRSQKQAKRANTLKGGTREKWQGIKNKGYKRKMGLLKGRISRIRINI